MSEQLVQARTVRVGGNERRLAPFRSYKVALALDILGGVGDQVLELLQTVEAERRRYAKDNPQRLTRQVCIEQIGEYGRSAETLRQQAATETSAKELVELEEAARALEGRARLYEQQLADMGDKDYVEYPGTMSQDQEILTALPLALKMRKQFVQLLGLALVADDELQDAWVTEDVFELLQRQGQALMFEMEAGEEVELIAVVLEMFQAQIRPRQGALDKLRALREWWMQAPPEETSNGSEPESAPAESPTSSTPSPEPTAGDQSESSSASSTT